MVIGELFFKISALAFACDLTRVIQYNWSGNTSNRIYANLGMTEGHHDISHQNTTDAFAKIRAINKHLWTQNLKLYEALKAMPDGDGTLWDKTLVVHWNELAQGDTHAINNNLVIFAGKADNAFRRGRYIDFANKQSFSDMLITCHQYMGFTDVTSFGDSRLAGAGAAARADLTAQASKQSPTPGQHERHAPNHRDGPDPSAVRVPLAVVPIVVIPVPLPAARGPVMAAALAHVVPARPNVAMVPPAVVAALPNVASTHLHTLLARGWRLVAPAVNDHHRRRLRRRRHGESPGLKEPTPPVPSSNSPYRKVSIADAGARAPTPQTGTASPRALRR